MVSLTQGFPGDSENRDVKLGEHRVERLNPHQNSHTDGCHTEALQNPLVRVEPLSTSCHVSYLLESLFPLPSSLEQNRTVSTLFRDWSMTSDGSLQVPFWQLNVGNSILGVRCFHGPLGVHGQIHGAQSGSS